MPPLILASASPRRSWLLSLMGVPFEVFHPEIDESRLGDESPEEHVERLAREKATVALRCFPGRNVLAADTAVVLGSKIYGKPRDMSEARLMLGELSGRTHRVLTGFAVSDADGLIKSGVEESLVTFKPFQEEGIEDYLALGESADKAGAYAAQGEGARIIERIEGLYTNVVGLPVRPLMRLLADQGYQAGDPGLDGRRDGPLVV
jgi:septum formation protein